MLYVKRFHIAPWLIVLLILGTVLSLPAELQAIGFEKFDVMYTVVQAEYIADVIEAVETAFRAEGRADLAAQADKFFTVIKEGDTQPEGIAEVEYDIARARVADLTRFQKDPKARRVDVEDALFVTLKKNNIFTPTMPQRVMDTMQKFHLQRASEFVRMSVPERRQFIGRLARVALPDYFLREHVAERVAKDGKNAATVADQKDAWGPEDIRGYLGVLGREFGTVSGASVESNGFDGVTKRLEATSATEPNDPVISILLDYVYDERLAELRQRAAQLRKKVKDAYDHDSIVLSDGRHVLPGENGDFWVITRNMNNLTELEEGYKNEAQRIYNCMNAGFKTCGSNPGKISPGIVKILLDALASSDSQNALAVSRRGTASATVSPPPVAPAPRPAQNKSKATDDDPIGDGGFISPPAEKPPH